MQAKRPEPKAGILSIAPYVGGKSGAGAVKLSSNETPLGASPAAQEAYVQGAASLHRYPDGTHKSLREAIGAAHGVDAARIVCGAGSDELIAFLIHAYAGAGDEMLYSEHGFLMYKIYAQSFGVTPVSAPEKGLRADVDALLAAVTGRTKIVFVANPNNPTGSYLSASEMKRLRDGLPPQVILAIDAAYSEYADKPDYACGSELVEGAENVVMLRTFSKIYGLSALRLGWLYGPAAIVDVINRIRGPFNVSAPALLAGAAAVTDAAFIERAQLFNTQWRDWLSAQIAQLGLHVYPSMANFVLVRFADRGQSEGANAFLAGRGLIVRDVVAYGLAECLRITVGLERDNLAVVAALRDFLAES